MPYIIETRTDPFGTAHDGMILSRVAVATLEEARELVRSEQPVPLEGGTVGPLPDGTTIDVRHVCDTWCILVAEDGGHEFNDPENVTVREGIDAYNAQQGGEVAAERTRQALDRALGFSGALNPPKHR